MCLKIYTIGFGQKSAKCFFGLLRDNGVRKVIDVRLNNVSQLAGFTKKKDLCQELIKKFNILKIVNY